jgi:hypothetical protein
VIKYGENESSKQIAKLYAKPFKTIALSDKCKISVLYNFKNKVSSKM